MKTTVFKNQALLFSILSMGVNLNGALPASIAAGLHYLGQGAYYYLSVGPGIHDAAFSWRRYQAAVDRVNNFAAPDPVLLAWCREQMKPCGEQFERVSIKVGGEGVSHAWVEGDQIVLRGRTANILKNILHSHEHDERDSNFKAFMGFLLRHEVGHVHYRDNVPGQKATRALGCLVAVQALSLGLTKGRMLSAPPARIGGGLISLSKATVAGGVASLCTNFLRLSWDRYAEWRADRFACAHTPVSGATDLRRAAELFEISHDDEIERLLPKRYKANGEVDEEAMRNTYLQWSSRKRYLFSRLAGFVGDPKHPNADDRAKLLRDTADRLEAQQREAARR